MHYLSNISSKTWVMKLISLCDCFFESICPQHFIGQVFWLCCVMGIISFICQSKTITNHYFFLNNEGREWGPAKRFSCFSSFVIQAFGLKTIVIEFLFIFISAAESFFGIKILWCGTLFVITLNRFMQERKKKEKNLCGIGKLQLSYNWEDTVSQQKPIGAS